MRRDRYRRAALQRAYELGYTLIYKHDAFPFTDRMASGPERVPPSSRAEAMAAAYEDGADALAALARESAKDGRRLGRMGR